MSSGPTGSAFVYRVLPCAIIVTAFPVVGYVVGWYVGNSQSPVVATLLPLVVGLLGAIGFGLLERRAVVGKVLDSIKSLPAGGQLDPALVAKVEDAVGGRDGGSFWLPALLSTGAMAFAVSSYFGTQAGIALRLPAPCPGVDVMMRDDSDRPLPVSPAEYADMHRLRMNLIAQGIPGTEIKAIFDTTFRPLFAGPDASPVRELTDAITPAWEDKLPESRALTTDEKRVRWPKHRARIVHELTDRIGEKDGKITRQVTGSGVRPPSDGVVPPPGAGAVPPPKGSGGD